MSKAINKAVVTEAYRGMVDIVKRGSIGDYMPIFSTLHGHRWIGTVCRECKMEYHKGHDPDCKVGHREGVGRLY